MTDRSRMEAPMSYALVRYRRDGWLGVESFARAAGTHPDLVVRFVALGLLDPERDRAGALWFAPDQLARLARIQRLRAAFSVNYAALGLVLDLLERVEQLERALRHEQRHRQRHPWT
ncbi:chaperone modulator CbpM [Amycolatopsis thermoflava]|uniref:chaperone modulator CbpM n=1 Tax=Amycolatopsis thermoflava TaxID=84480 RepID=UPI00364A5A3C